MTDQELKDLVASLAISQAETDRQMKETDRQMKETDRQMKETDRQMKETDRQMKETDRRIEQVNKQVGEIGNKFGRFTEGMAEPSMRKLLGEKFGMTAIQPRALFRSGDKRRSLEVDVFGYDKDDLREEVYIVEVKSLLTVDGISQALKTISDFRELGPAALRHRPIYGVVAAVEIPEHLDEAVASRGLYLARINDDTFQLLTPPGFKPKLFVDETHNGKSNGHAKGRSRKKKTHK